MKVSREKLKGWLVGEASALDEVIADEDPFNASKRQEALGSREILNALLGQVDEGKALSEIAAWAISKMSKDQSFILGQRDRLVTDAKKDITSNDPSVKEGLSHALIRGARIMRAHGRCAAVRNFVQFVS